MKRKLILFALAVPFFLSSCGESAPQESPAASSEVSPATSSGTNGELIPISSSNVIAAGFDANLLVMTVKFNNGAVYEYYDVPISLWEEFVAAQPHPWSQVGYPRLVQAGVANQRIG